VRSFVAKPATGQVLQYDGDNWVNSSAPSGPTGATGAPGVIPTQGFQTGLYYTSPTTSFTTRDALEATTYYTSFYIGQTVSIDRIAISTVSGFSGTSVIRLGVYNNANGGPSTVAFDAGTVLCTAPFTSYSITVSQTLGPGWYWLASNSQTKATTNNLVASTTFSVFGMSLTGGILSDPKNIFTQSGVTGAFATAIDLTPNPSAPLVGLRFI
jgi:hypothetical protein